jgi:hypothetical protein
MRLVGCVVFLRLCGSHPRLARWFRLTDDGNYEPDIIA